jgi:hypothetical protein
MSDALLEEYVGTLVDPWHKCGLCIRTYGHRDACGHKPG